MKKTTVLLVLFSLSINLFSQGYKIKVNITDLRDSSIYLGYHFGSKQYLRDTISLDKNGEGIFKGEEKLPGGIYLIVLPGMKYFEILLDDNQEFFIQAQSEDIVNNLKFKNSNLNTGFNEYQRYMIEQQTNAGTLRKKIETLEESSDSINIIKEEIKNIDKNVNSYWEITIKKYPNTLLSTIIKAMKTVEIPEFEVDKNIKNKDSIKWVLSYNYNKNHYFDNINFSDSSILRTPIYENKINYFFTKLLLQSADSIIKEADKILIKAKANKEIFQTTLVFLLNHFQKSNIMGLDRVFVHLAENYYLSGEAAWADSTFLSKLAERVIKLKPNLIGNTAPDLKMESITGEYVRLHEVDADFTILLFWEPDCGHCKKEIPAIYELYQKYIDKNIKVFAVFTQHEKDKWIEFVEKNGLDWINVYDPYHLSNFRNYYDILGTPVVLMLDKDKKIIAKKVNVETLEKMLGHLLEN